MATKKVITSNGKLRYASQIRAEQKRLEQRRSGEFDWADYKPKHRLGVFGNVMTNPHQHNNERKYL